MAEVIDFAAAAEARRVHEAGAVEPLGMESALVDFRERARTLGPDWKGPQLFAWNRADAMMDAILETLALDPDESFMNGGDAVGELRDCAERAISRWLEAQRRKR